MNRLRWKCVLIVILCVFCAQQAGSADFNKKEEDAFYVAVKAYEDGFYDASLTLFDRYLKTYVQSDKKLEALLTMGQCYFFQEKYIKALDQFESLLKMEGAGRIKDKVLFWLGEVYAKGRDYKQAAEFYKELINNYKDSFYFLSGYKALAQVQLSEGKYQEAQETYRAIRLQFKDALVAEEALFGVCESLYRMRDYEKLKKELKDFIAEYPHAALLGRAYFYLGEANFYLEQYDDAIIGYRDAQNASTDAEMNNQAQIGIGWSYLKIKRYDEAKAIFSKFDEENQPLGITLGRAVLDAGLGAYDESLGLFENVIAADKEESYAPLAYFGKAEALYNLSKFDEAIIAYKISLDKLKTLKGGYAEGRELRDKIHYGLAWAYLKVGDFPSAVGEFQKVASLSSDKIFKLSALCQLGDTYQDAGDYKKAQETYQNFLRDYPDSVYNDYVQYQLGMTWLKMENLDSAVLAFRKLLKDFPNSKLVDQANYFIGVAYFKKGDFAAAREQLENFINSFKESSARPQAVFLLGESLLNLSQWKAAIDVFGKVIKEFADNETLRQKAEYEIASAYASSGNEAEADKRLSDFIARYPDSHLSPDILYWLGHSYTLKKNYLDSRKYFERLIRNYPQHEFIAEAFLEMGTGYLEEGNAELAIRNFQQAKENGKKGAFARACFLLGDVYLSKYDFDNALKNYKEAVLAGEGWAKGAYLKMATVYENEKMYKEAIDALEKGLSAEGGLSNAELQYKIAELLEEEGSSEAALEAYLKVTYLYPAQEAWVVKALLNVARIYENKEDRNELKSVLEKISKYNVPEAKYAKEKLQGLGK